MVAGPAQPPAWRPLAAFAALIVLLAGCTYSEREPGLFRPSALQASETSKPELLPPRKTNPALPVAGEAIWTTGEGLRVTVRFAIHAIRRIEGASVLDWSVTPLTAPRLRAGEQLPGRVDLGLTSQAAGDGNIVLSDGAGRVYRQLTHTSRAEFNRCLCSPIWAAQLGLRLGETRMLQLTFPELPADVEFLDVSWRMCRPSGTSQSARSGRRRSPPVPLTSAGRRSRSNRSPAPYPSRFPGGKGGCRASRSGGSSRARRPHRLSGRSIPIPTNPASA